MNVKVKGLEKRHFVICMKSKDFIFAASVAESSDRRFGLAFGQVKRAPRIGTLAMF
jgi:hypothetical protein